MLQKAKTISQIIAIYDHTTIVFHILRLAKELAKELEEWQHRVIIEHDEQQINDYWKTRKKGCMLLEPETCSHKINNLSIPSTKIYSNSYSLYCLPPK